MGLIVRRVNISGAEGINFGNLRTGIFKLRKFQLCLLAPLLHSSNPLDLAARLPGRPTQFTRWEITVFARLAASLATAIQALRCPDRERSWVWPPELILQSEDAIGSFHSGYCWRMQIAPRTRKNVAIRNWRRTVGEPCRWAA